MEATNKLSDACRLCDENKEKMLSIFDKTEEGQQIIGLIKACLPLVIFRTDPLSKQICADCYTNVKTFYKFKKTSLNTATKHIQHLRQSEDNGTSSKSMQLYLACEDAEMNDIISLNSSTKKESKTTCTDDLTISCINCKSTYFDSSIINSEVELCAELHKAIADSFTSSKVNDGDKAVRARRRRSQAFYHELDDSLCSSLTEFTNTESSQCYEEYVSEMDSYESDADNADRAKRRKLNPEDITCNGQPEVKESPINTKLFITRFQEESEYRYDPLSLMCLALNVVNKKIVPECEPDDFYQRTVRPKCRYCSEEFKNTKLLALHEVGHINIELGEKVDNPIPWHESRDDAIVRNKWLSRYDEVECEDENSDMDIEGEEDDTGASESLLIPSGSEPPEEPAGEILLVMGKPVVAGIPLNEYSKAERKSFYQTMKIAGANKKFCRLCRYSFKDNWAIESHYYSMACYYTCRYCGMRFNKQRNRFDEHVQEHQIQGDVISKKIFAASKLNNFVPRVIPFEKVKKFGGPETPTTPKVKVKTLPQNRPQTPTNIRIKEEKPDSDVEEKHESDVEEPPKKKSNKSTKVSNQAYFCRKCYKVFFKLDEFNIHSKNCDYNQFPPSRNSFQPKTNGDMVSPAGRPMRHCVKEVSTYKDEAYSSDGGGNPAPITSTKEPPPQQFVCFLCNTAFPNIYSRNSHMRIHKGETRSGPSMLTRTQPKREVREVPKRRTASPVLIKKEPLEPEVEIHEPQHRFSNSNRNSIAAVSITPISRNPNQKATINPNIMKLVQNNPHLTIKAHTSPERVREAPATSSTSQSSNDGDKTYKCSSCWEAFNNKSHLYFHKKNQCEGSKYPCPFCKKRFGTETAYSSHIFYSHPE